MTREECLNALKDIIARGGNQEELFYWACGFQKEIKLLTDLIEEHFSNPPLTWEELKECNVVYDKKLKKYRLINELLEDGFIYFTYTTDTRIGEYYEPNRFYRKEVQE